MSMDDCFIPLPSPLRDRWRCGSHPCLSQLDLDDRAAAGSGTAGEKLPRMAYKGNSLHAFPEEEPKQHQVTLSRAALKGRYARLKENLNAGLQETKQHHHQVAVSCAASKWRRGAPEGINMEEHAWRFQPLPPLKWKGDFDRAPIGIPSVMRKRKPLEVRNRPRPHFRSENDVIMCCIVGENDGRCYGCQNYQPVVHPSSEAYGGSSTCIDYPGSDGESDSD
ncbi:hypothetical protein ZWY2020_036975 [Hordeum vulgare]|nr:hypothetical protein ZWY2020_036975 [Hordeum vulgare]